MSTLDLVTIAWASGFGLGALLGYGVPKLYARAVAKAVERERVVAALSGESRVPAWEQTARALEQAAVQQAQSGASVTSRHLLEQAADVRALGRKHGR